MLARCSCDKSDLQQSPPPSLVLCDSMVRCIEQRPLCNCKANTPNSKWGSPTSRTFPLCFLGIWAAGDAVDTSDTSSSWLVLCVLPHLPPSIFRASSRNCFLPQMCSPHQLMLGWTCVSTLSFENFSSSKVPINTILRHFGQHRAGAPSVTRCTCVTNVTVREVGEAL